jgi:hypothetical protein
MILQPVGVAILTTEIVMNLIFMVGDISELLDLLHLGLVDVEIDVEDDGVEYDEDGIAWCYDEDLDATFYFDEDLDDWAEVDEEGFAWYLDEETGALYFFDEESDDWVEYDDSEDESEDESASW